MRVAQPFASREAWPTGSREPTVFVRSGKGRQRVHAIDDWRRLPGVTRREPRVRSAPGSGCKVPPSRPAARSVYSEQSSQPSRKPNWPTAAREVQSLSHGWCYDDFIRIRHAWGRCSTTLSEREWRRASFSHWTNYRRLLTVAKSEGGGGGAIVDRFARLSAVGARQCRYSHVFNQVIGKCLPDPTRPKA